MKNCLIDAGPIIALFDKNDQHHAGIKSFLKKFKGRLITSWPVLTEVSHMLSFNINAQIDMLKWIERGAVFLFLLNEFYLKRIIDLTEKYVNVPMDLADASLIIAAEETGIRNIITIDRDYNIYRTAKKEWLNNLFNRDS